MFSSMKTPIWTVCSWTWERSPGGTRAAASFESAFLAIRLTSFPASCRVVSMPPSRFEVRCKHWWVCDQLLRLPSRYGSLALWRQESVVHVLEELIGCR